MENISLLRSLTEENLRDKRVLLRIDLNVPIENSALLDDYRIKRALPTIEFLKKKKSKVVIISHHPCLTQTLRPMEEALAKYIPAAFIEDVSDAQGIRDALDDGRVAVCENLRFHDEEESNDEDFAKRLAMLGDLYVNDAFSASHRNHASIVLIPKFLPSHLGFLFEEEIQKLSIAFNPPHKFLFVLGGGKSKSKFHLIKKFLPIADAIFVGGALSFNFFKAMGYEIGASYYEEVDVPADLVRHKKILLPIDVRTRHDEKVMLKKPEEVEKNDSILDIGPQTLAMLKEHIKEVRFILWNGPLGDYLVPGFGEGTLAFIDVLRKSKAQIVAGGGDTTAFISQCGAQNVFDFISTGGGSMLDFLAEGTLPGIEALKLGIRH